MSYMEAKAKYAALGVDTDAAIRNLLLKFCMVRKDAARFGNTAQRTEYRPEKVCRILAE